MTPAEEGDKVRQLGMDYANIQVRTRTCRPGTVDLFRRVVQRLPKPVYVHCKLGARAGAMAIMDLAVDRQMSGEQARARARELGIDLRDERLVALIKEYVDGQIVRRT